MVTRRDLIRAALAAGVLSASPARAQSVLAPSSSPIPLPRPAAVRLAAIPTGADLIANAGIGGHVGYVVADAGTGDVLESFDPHRPLPPASSAKAITTAYALDRLGPEYRFRTQVLAMGPVEDGRLDGDLWLVGGGDPVLDTDALAGMVADAGLTEVTGRFLVSYGALPHLWQIDPLQPAHVGYNPAISGLNLNFNRVYFQWVREDDAYTVTMDARSETRRPAIDMAQMTIADRATPVYTYAEVEGTDRWTVAEAALGQGGSRWLPVRTPHLYAGEVFRILARDAGLRLPEPEMTEEVPAAATVLVDRASAPLSDILRDMMRWSTNLTAEIVGLTATRSQGGSPRSLLASARQMGNWARGALGQQHPRFVDHSGLGDGSRLTAADMARAMVNAGADGALRGLMRAVPMRDESGEIIEDHDMQVDAKTGTLNFVSALAGYATHGPSGRDLAFAIFCGDLDRRSALTLQERERPEGGRTYNSRAKRLQQALIERWGVVYGDLRT